MSEEKDVGLKTCPNCNETVSSLVAVDAGIRKRLAEATGNSALPAELCKKCFALIGKQISAGAQIQLKEKFKEQQKLELWKSRVPVLKQARQCMAQKLLSEAAMSFEKYLRIVELIYDLNPGELTPDPLRKASQNHELTVLASVYWDLLRIYDSHARYAQRQKMAAEKLSLFVTHTPIYPDVLRKAQGFARKSKNPEAFKLFLKSVGASKSRCFIATSAFESPYAPEVLLLVRFREDYLRGHLIGNMVICVYNFVSPPIARWLDNHDFAREKVRTILQQITKFVRRNFY